MLEVGTLVQLCEFCILLLTLVQLCEFCILLLHLLSELLESHELTEAIAPRLACLALESYQLLLPQGVVVSRDLGRLDHDPPLSARRRLDAVV